MMLLVTSYCLTTSRSRRFYTYKSLKKSCEKIMCLPHWGMRTHPTHLVCLCYWQLDLCLKQVALLSQRGRAYLSVVSFNSTKCRVVFYC